MDGPTTPTPEAATIAYQDLEIKYSKEDIPKLQALIEKTKAVLEERRQKHAALVEDTVQRRAKIAQLTNDEAAVRNQEQDALKGRFKLQRRLSSVGGHENTLKMLMTTLAATKQEVIQVRQNKVSLSASHKELEKEHAALTAAVAKTKTNIESYNRERLVFEGKRRDVDLKLNQIATFLTS
ncbi:Aste57867_20093 [Aphanomyces stellatus]|uniref:Aste57867_20093 protein n=1 Tax=Aphanomyces stellatus TaxID=120398 RepID=A0A485LG43_9STRA|nr:hypothetical protein As57867_020027 [Aphanomyces stellatus]VFT96788.1 Aste57867_20093 [Aphanomyces stellatus]